MNFETEYAYCVSVLHNQQKKAHSSPISVSVKKVKNVK